ncbi:unknown; predicted coding region [Mycoplasmopsis pulmonis]|uniref:Uncharacterized protein n=1 Tax=Mycoplasmopsis pulmonis (strain UAB CTIP) TaxID=272635 RepID=Q98RB9_MYCPU|nr:hypothetical protein [Mycoplasmopsis pulmonis]CAC13263.1 unknown; predicted coding region [Mycoplasmopsis pulmonis]VEU67856.1 Uncharacterised protein [Mycoplasmopsis pulmonis]
MSDEKIAKRMDNFKDLRKNLFNEKEMRISFYQSNPNLKSIYVKAKSFIPNLDIYLFDVKKTNINNYYEEKNDLKKLSYEKFNKNLLYDLKKSYDSLSYKRADVKVEDIFDDEFFESPAFSEILNEPDLQTHKKITKKKFSTIK